MTVAEIDNSTSALLGLVILPGGLLCLMGLIVCKGASRYFAVLLGCSLLAALGSILVSTSLSQTFVEPSFLDSFSKDGVWVVNPKYRPDLSQLLWATAVVSAAFVIAVHQLWRGPRWAGRGLLIVACSALSAVAVWIWTVGGLYGYRMLVNG